MFISKVKVVAAIAALVGVVACDEAANGADIAQAGTSTAVRAPQASGSGIEAFAVSLADAFNSGPTIRNGQGVIISGATASGNRLSLDMSLPRGGTQRSFARFDTRIEEWQRRDLCASEPVARFIAQGGEVEVDIQSRNGSSLHRVLVQDCN